MSKLSMSAATRYGCVAAVWVAACGGAPFHDFFDPAADGSVSGRTEAADGSMSSRTADDAGTEVHDVSTSDRKPSGPEVSPDAGVDRGSPSGTNVGAGGMAGRSGQGGEGGTGGRGSGGAGVGGASDGGGGSAGGVAGQGGAADSGGDAGTGGGYVDAGPLGVCSYPNPVTLFYRTMPRFDGVIDFAVKIVNDSTTSKALGSLSARYYLSREISNPAATVVYGSLCCPDESLTWGMYAAIRAVVPPAPGADAFVEITFDEDAGWLDPGQLIEVEVEVRSQSGINASPRNDYSFVPTATGAQEQWDDCPLDGDCDTFRSCRVTVHDDGRLLWGQPPR